MKNTLMESRVRSLEEMMADLIATVEQTSIEMREFKDEVKVLVKGMRSLGQQLDQIVANASVLKSDKSSVFKTDNSDSWTEQRRKDRRDFTREWARISDKHGTMTEDLVVPNIDRIFHEVVDCDPKIPCGWIERSYWHHPVTGERRRFGLIAECDDYVLVNETRSELIPTDIDELINTIEDVREYFPRYRGRKFIGSLATLDVDDSMITLASQKGIIILAVGEELMDVMNEPGFKPAIF